MNTVSALNRERFYFSHDYGSRNDPKILELRSEYGLKGLGLYWCIVETLAEASDGYINPKLLGGISVGFGISKSRLQEYINFMITIELLREDENGYYSERMMKHKKLRRKLSEAGRRGAENRWKDREIDYETDNETDYEVSDEVDIEVVGEANGETIGEANGVANGVPNGEANAKERKGDKSKLKDTKSKDTKSKDTKSKDTKSKDTKSKNTKSKDTKIKKGKSKSVFNFRKALLDDGFNKDLVDEWLYIRKSKKAINTQFAYNTFIEEVGLAGGDKNTLLATIARRQWANFDHTWLDEKKNNSNNNSTNNSKPNSYETDWQDSESDERKQQIGKLAQGVGMVPSNQVQHNREIW